MLCRNIFSLPFISEEVSCRQGADRGVDKGARIVCLWDEAVCEIRQGCMIVSLRNAACYLCLACQGCTLESHPPPPRMNVPSFIDKLQLDATRCSSSCFVGRGESEVAMKAKANTGEPFGLWLVTSART